MYSYSNTKVLSFTVKGTVCVGKLFRYLENFYYQNYPNIQFFADYKFDVRSKIDKNDQELLRSIVQSYIYLHKKYGDKVYRIKVDLSKILELMKNDNQNSTEKNLNYESIQNWKSRFIQLLKDGFGNKIMYKKWKVFGEFDLSKLDDDTKIGVLSELYLLKESKYKLYEFIIIKIFTYTSALYKKIFDRDNDKWNF